MINSATELQKEDWKNKSEDKSMLVRRWEPPIDEITQLRKEILEIKEENRRLREELEEIKKDIDFKRCNR
jgi:hypothetical protein